MKNARGFSLIELLVVIAAMSILTVSFGAYWLSNRDHYRLMATVGDLQGDLKWARGVALAAPPAANGSRHARLVLTPPTWVVERCEAYNENSDGTFSCAWWAKVRDGKTAEKITTEALAFQYWDKGDKVMVPNAVLWQGDATIEMAGVGKVACFVNAKGERGAVTLDSYVGSISTKVNLTACPA